MKTARALSTLAVLALLPTIPPAIYGFAGHDFRFHFSSWMEMATAWKQGNIWPCWAEAADFNLGDPHLCYYPPFSFMVGSLLSFLLPLRMAPAAFIWLSLFISGLSMYAAGGHFVAPKDRLTAAVLYMGSPYLLLTALNRFDAAELLTMSWMPLVLLYFYEAVWLRKRKAMVLLGALLGLSWLTNFPASLILLYSLFIVACISTIRQRSLLPALCYAGAACIGVALAAFRLAPTFFERKWVRPRLVLRYDFRSFFILIPFSRLVSKNFQLCCWLFACLEFVLIALCAYTWHKKRTNNSTEKIFVELAAVAFIFQLPITTVLWEVLPEFRFIGFSYRFLGLIAATLPLVLLAKNSPRALRWPAYVLIGLMACLPFIGYTRGGFQGRSRPYPGFDGVIASLRQGYQGVPEYVPVGAVSPTAPIHLPAVAAEPSDVVSNCQVTAWSAGSQLRELSTDSSRGCRVRLALFFYPYWRAFDESHRRLSVEKNPEGLLVVLVPPGRHTVRIVFKAASSLRTATAIVSIVMAFLIGFLLAGPSRLLMKTQSASDVDRITDRANC
jgi:6-pyruvoyl-tetrahydropterin synthase related domain